MRQKFDTIVIGAGHNGLVTAAYLAKQGKKVCVLERRHILGGCTVTEELWPGYKVSTASYVISLFLPEIIRELRLNHYGLKILPRNPSSFTPLLEGRSLLMGNDMRANQDEIAKFSKKDAEAYPDYQTLLERVASVLDPLLNRPAPNPLPLPKSWRKQRWTSKMKDASQLWDLYQSLGELGEDLPDAFELLTGAARPILERWFEAEVLRATLATDAVIGAFSSISSPGTAYVLLHHVMGEAGGARGVWGYVQGGMGSLATALAAACEDMGVEILREAEVEKIVVEDGKTSGVLLTDNRYLEAPVVASSVDAHWTFERFIDAEHLPDTFRRQVAKIDYSSASAKINLALSEPPRFSCLPSSGVAPHHHGTMHVSPTLDYIERAYDDAKYGRPSAEPVLEMTMPSSIDTTVAPDGKHVMSMFVQFAPYKLANGSWDDIKDDFGKTCIDLLARYAPNVPDAIEHCQILSPLDLERTFRLTGGNIMQGAMNPHQLFFMRPVAGWADHRSPVAGVYLCGAASHPGGGVMGACGRNAANVILKDFG
jgi:phytoene dehydrogenase-like protein